MIMYATRSEIPLTSTMFFTNDFLTEKVTPFDSHFYVHCTVGPFQMVEY